VRERIPRRFPAYRIARSPSGPAGRASLRMKAVPQPSPSPSRSRASQGAGSAPYLHLTLMRGA
jgi:hypothetical protein